MEELLTFITNNGWQLGLIAALGVFILGVLKYANIFAKLSKKVRHILYMVISVGVSLIGSLIYLLATNNLDVTAFFALGGAIFALNQSMYSLYDTLTLKELIKKLLKTDKRELKNTIKKSYEKAKKESEEE